MRGGERRDRRDPADGAVAIVAIIIYISAASGRAVSHLLPRRSVFVSRRG